MRAAVKQTNSDSYCHTRKEDCCDRCTFSPNPSSVTKTSRHYWSCYRRAASGPFERFPCFESSPHAIGDKKQQKKEVRYAPSCGIKSLDPPDMCKAFSTSMSHEETASVIDNAANQSYALIVLIEQYSEKNAIHPSFLDGLKAYWEHTFFSNGATLDGRLCSESSISPASAKMATGAPVFVLGLVHQLTTLDLDSHSSTTPTHRKHTRKWQLWRLAWMRCRQNRSHGVL